MTERLYTTEDAAAELGVPANAIAKWKHRGQVEPADYLDGLGRGRHNMVPLYSLEALRPLATAYLRRKAATRREVG